MKVIVKKLQGGECNIEVSPATLISEIKRQVAKKLSIPVEQQKILHIGRTLADEQTVESYSSIKDGTKLNLIVKKPESDFDVFVKHFKKLGMSETEAQNTTNRFLKVVKEEFYKLSWDDIEKLAEDCLLEEKGDKRRVGEHEGDCEDMSSL